MPTKWTTLREIMSVLNTMHKCIGRISNIWFLLRLMVDFKIKSKTKKIDKGKKFEKKEAIKMKTFRDADFMSFPKKPANCE